MSPPKIGSYHPHPPSPLLLLLSPFYRPTDGGIRPSTSNATFPCFVGDGLDNFRVGLSDFFPDEDVAVDSSSYTFCGEHSGAVDLGELITISCSSVSHKYRYVVVQSLDETEEKLCLAEVAVGGTYYVLVARIHYCCLYMLTVT